MVDTWLGGFPEEVMVDLNSEGCIAVTGQRWGQGLDTCRCKCPHVEKCTVLVCRD